MTRRLNISDVHGLADLALDIAAKVTDSVEEFHTAIASPFGLFRGSAPGRTGGIAGFVYRTIHRSYQLAALGLDAAVHCVTPMFESPPSTLERESMVAILNGVWGDQLAAADNPLAIEMSLRHEGKSLSLSPADLRAVIPEPAGKLLVLVHGLCMNDLQWGRSEHHHGMALACERGYSVVHLHYNSGLHVSENGSRFAELLDELVQAWPVPVDELVLIGHSMGGLVVRSACHYASQAGRAWTRRLRKVIFLGTPHHGSHLERLGNWVGDLLNSTPYSAPIGRLGMNRSPGITDLRHGNIVHEDWQGVDRFAPGPDKRQAIALPDGVECYVMGATLGERAGSVKDRLLGDGLVPLDSALGYHQQPGRTLPLPESHRWVGYNMGHLDLLNSCEVYDQIREWLDL